MSNKIHRLLGQGDLHTPERRGYGDPNELALDYLVDGQYYQDRSNGSVYRYNSSAGRWDLLIGYNQSSNKITNVSATSEQSKIGELRDSIGKTDDNESGVITSVPAYLYAQVREGEDILIISVDDSEQKITLTVSETTNAGEVSIPVQEQSTQKTFSSGSAIELDGGLLQSYFTVDPTKLSISIEGEREATSLGTVGLALVAAGQTRTSLTFSKPGLSASNEIRLKDGQILTLQRITGLSQEIVVDGDQNFSSSPFTVNFETFTTDFIMGTANQSLVTYLIEPAYSASSRISITESNIELSVQYNDNGSYIELLAGPTDSEITLQADQINITGVINAINSEGVTTIDGGRITTDSILADQIDTSDLFAEQLTIGSKGGVPGYIQSLGYQAGSTGFRINSDGTAEFRDVSVYGQIVTGIGSDIDGQYIVAKSVTANEIAANTITANEILAGTITSAQIASNTITANEIAANTITASEIAAGTITATQIAANTITASEIAANTITASQIAAGTITATQIAADTITSSEIAAGAITANEISASSVTADKINVSTLSAITANLGTITAGTIDASLVTVSNISAGNITTGTLSADRIGADTITADKIDVANLSAVNASTGALTVDGTLTISTGGQITGSNYSLTDAGGNIAGWTVGNNVLQSATSGTRIELNKAQNRISIFDAVGEKAVMGYLDGLPKNDGTGNWGSSDYGFWAKNGDYLQIDGDMEYESGDWLIRNDASLKIFDGFDREILRLGTDSNNKGLFLYDTSGDKLAQYRSDAVIIGDDTTTEYLKYQSGVLTVRGSINADDITAGTIDTGRLNVSGVITAINNEGSTTIDGDKITTGTITADRLNVSNLSSVDSNTGALTVSDTLTIGASGKLYYNTGVADGNGIISVDRTGLTVYANDLDNIGIKFGNDTSGTTATIKPTLSGHIAVSGDIVSSGSIRSSVGNIRGAFQSSDGTNGITTTETWFDSNATATHTVTVKNGIITSWSVTY